MVPALTFDALSEVVVFGEGDGVSEAHVPAHPVGLFPVEVVVTDESPLALN